ncbi:MAG TPA: XdhC family protein, partial [Pseudonocardia sp.]|nr:XdhC family protein [Pseudonocardia sp.]
MRDVLDSLVSWWDGGKSTALATVVATFRSAPRQPGASMLVGAGGEAVGSVSGGCVEGAVYELGNQVLGGGRSVLQRYGVSDDDAFAVGLTCGGILDVFVEKIDQETFPQLREVVEA